MAAAAAPLASGQPAHPAIDQSPSRRCRASGCGFRVGESGTAPRCYGVRVRPAGGAETATSPLERPPAAATLRCCNRRDPTAYGGSQRAVARVLLCFREEHHGRDVHFPAMRGNQVSRQRSLSPPERPRSWRSQRRPFARERPARPHDRISRNPIARRCAYESRPRQPVPMQLLASEPMRADPPLANTGSVASRAESPAFVFAQASSLTRTRGCVCPRGAARDGGIGDEPWLLRTRRRSVHWRSAVITCERRALRDPDAPDED